MEYFEYNSEIFNSDISNLTNISKPERLIENQDGFINGEKNLVLFSVDNLINHPHFNKVQILNTSLSDIKLLENSYNVKINLKLIGTVNRFDSQYFDESKQKSKSSKKFVMKEYLNKIDIVDEPYLLLDFENFISRWIEVRKNKYFRLYVGKDKCFVKNYLSINKSKLISKFFYLNGKIVGYSIFEKINDTTYNYLFGKADTSYKKLGFFIDYYSIKDIYDKVQTEIIVNFGLSGVNSGLHLNKTNNFNVAGTYESYIVTVDNTKIIKSSSEMTPIVKLNNVFFKRDDLYCPYEDKFAKLNGTKLRQMQYIINTIFSSNQNKFTGVMTYCQVNSIQSLIVSKVASDFGIKCIIGIGGVKENKINDTISKNKPLEYSKNLGAEIVNIAPLGYNSNLKFKAKLYAQENDLFLIDFGIFTESNPYSVISGIVNQVNNIPCNLDNIIVPCGSGITLAGVIIGCSLLNKNAKRIFGIHISGHDRRKQINKMLINMNLKKLPSYEYEIDKTYSYSKKINQIINNSIELNKIYEAKAYEYFIKNRENLGIKETDKTLFWIIANNNEFLN